MQCSEGARPGGRDEKRVSQLCKPLWNCLHDQSPLSILEYLIQFMAARDALHLLQFWFSVASFRNAAAPVHSWAATSTRHRDTQHYYTPVTTGVLQKTPDTPTTQPYHTTTAEHTTEHSMLTAELPTPLSTTPGNSLYDTEAPNDVHTDDNISGVACGGSDEGMNGVAWREGRSCGGTGHTMKHRPPDITRQPSLNVVTDAMGIYTTYVALNALTPVNIPDDIRQRVEVSICPEDGIVDRTCFNEAQQFVYDSIEKQYYQEFLRSSYMCKYELEVISSGGLCLLDILLGGDSLTYFMEFMEAENAMPLLQFWLTAESFHTHQNSSVDATVEDAITIYDRYFSLQATEPLGMEDKVRVDIELAICDERGPCADSFLAAQHIAYDRMNENYYPHFLESSIYLKFLDGLLCTVKLTTDQQNVTEPRHSQVEQTTNNCSSSQTETKTVDYFTYDVDDPESLWRRPHLLMRLGSVDGMGQYCSEIDPFPTKTMKSRDHSKHHFRWFRNRQEEEEWQLAVKVSRHIIAKVLKRTSRTSRRK